MTILNATIDNFYEESSEGLVLVDFWAPWCGPCKMIAPILDELAEEMKDAVKIIKVNVDENPELAATFEIMSIPNMIILKNGEIEDSVIGYAPKEVIEDLINEHK
jgi:thioredoxin 1